MKNLVQKLAVIQQELICPKGQYNKFGGFAYRNCEDILESVKPHLGDLALTVEDEIVCIDGRFYVKACAILTDGEHSVSNTAYAREPEAKKGMDASQITGATSSYARKYALNGLFCIDDTKDADSDNSNNPITYSKQQFDKLSPTWLKAIDEGKKTSEDILGYLASKNVKLTEHQANIIRGVK
jgi:hypothetical protein